MGAAASSSKYREIHGASEEDLKSVFAELTAEEKDRVEMALEAAEKPHTDHGWSDMMHRWEGDGHAHPEIEEEDLSKEQHDDAHWTIMDTFKLEKLFHSIDVDGDGEVTRKEWQDALKEFGDDLRTTFGHTVDDIDAVFDKFDTDGNGTLSWDEFQAAAPTKAAKEAAAEIEKPHTEHGWSDMVHRWEADGHAHPEIEEEDLSKQEHDDEHWTIMDTFKLEKLFESIDVNGDGQVTKEEWEKALKEFGDDLRHTFGHTVDDIEKVFAKFDTDGDGTLSWEEFSAAAPIPKDD
jgi:Ca2+-binding EF-hand superfamily protein